MMESNTSENAVRMLLPRHVKLDDNNIVYAVNKSVLCGSAVIPDIRTYFSAMNVYGIILFTYGGLSLLILMFVYIDTLTKVMRSSSTDVKTHTALVLSVYPVVGCVSYCVMIVPRAQLLSEAITQGAFMMAMYQLFCLIIAYNGGEDEFISRMKHTTLETRVPPCCCWPCCLLPRPQLNKRVLYLLRMLVLQLPIIQGIIYVVLLLMWAEEENLYEVNYVYVQPLVIGSIICGVWGVIMTLRAAGASSSLKGKFFALQAVLVLAKLQGLIVRVMPTDFLPCKVPITPAVYLNLINNVLMLTEMLALSLWARYLYTREEENICNTFAKPIHQVLEKSNVEIDIDGIDNKSYKRDS